MTAVQTTESGKPQLGCPCSRPFTKAALKDFFATRTVLPLMVVSHGLACFTVAEGMGAVHDRLVTGCGKASVFNEKFRTVNTLIGDLKTALTGAYHAVKFARYAYRYLAEAQFRLNRRCDLRAILGNLVRAVVTKPQQPERAIESKADELNLLMSVSEGHTLANLRNTRGTGLGDMLAGIEGFPYAPGDTGNVCTEKIVDAVGLLSHDTGVDLDKRIAAANCLPAQIGHDVPSKLVKAGRRLYLHPRPADY